MRSRLSHVHHHLATDRTLAPPTRIIIPEETRNITNNNRLTPENEAFAEPVSHPSGPQKGPAPPPPSAIIQFHILTEPQTLSLWGSAESETRTLSPLHTAGLSYSSPERPVSASQPAWPLRPSARLLTGPVRGECLRFFRGGPEYDITSLARKVAQLRHWPGLLRTKARVMAGTAQLHAIFRLSRVMIDLLWRVGKMWANAVPCRGHVITICSGGGGAVVT